MRLYIFTDTHLGHKEHHDSLSDDSFRAFEEGLLMARKVRAHLALHSGDLFDTQRPSQTTMTRTMQLLRSYCLEATADGQSGEVLDSAKQLRVLGRHKDGATYNFERPHLRHVPLPIFIIHGNHDPPVLTQADKPVTAPLDILEAACLINDIGQHQKLDPLIIRPALIEQGPTIVAVYGIGHIRDERMNRMFELNKIVFEPPSKEIAKTCYCILLIHQNRYKGMVGRSGAPAKSCVHEELLPDFFDLIIWGHEHDCDIELRKASNGRSFITQPGSSVCTSLRAGEAIRKRNAILELGRKPLFISFPLLTPRPFVFSHVSVGREESNLQELLHCECVAALNEAKERLIARDSEWLQAIDQICNNIAKISAQQLKIECTGLIRDGDTGMRPLVRLRVEVPSDYDLSELSTTRFGIQYQEKIANSEDILQITREGRRRLRKEGEQVSEMNDIGGLPSITPDPDDGKPPEEAIFDNIAVDKQLGLLSESALNDCVKKYANKSDLRVFEDLLQDTQLRALKILSQQQSTEAWNTQESLTQIKTQLWAQ